MTNLEETQKRLAQAQAREARKNPKPVTCSIPCIKTLTEEEIQAREPKKKAVDIKTLLKSAGVGKRFLQSTLLSYIPRNKVQEIALSKCKDYVLKNSGLDGNGLILMGIPNTGKTHLLTGIIRSYLMAGTSAHYLTVEDFFFLLQTTFNSKTLTESEVIGRLLIPQILVLDDLQSLKSKDDAWQYRRLWHLLDKRYADMKATLVSTNKSLSGFKEMLDERTGRRLQAEIIPLDL